MGRIKTELVVKGIADLSSDIRKANFADTYQAVHKLDDKFIQELDEAVTLIRNFLHNV